MCNGENKMFSCFHLVAKIIILFKCLSSSVWNKDSQCNNIMQGSTYDEQSDTFFIYLFKYSSFLNAVELNWIDEL